MKTVAIPEARYSSEFAGLFTRAGAQVRRCPLATESVLEDRSSIQSFVELAIASNLDATIFMTGIGVNLILKETEAIGMRESFLGALSRMMVVSRGSKSTAALRKANVRIDLIPAAATSEGLVESLSSQELSGKRIAVQLYGTPNPKRCSALESRGAKVFPVSVYTYEAASNPAEVESFIRDIIAGKIHILAFTSAPQVHALFDAAATLGVVASLNDSLTHRLQVASIGEVTSRALETHGIQPHIVPDEPKMGAMVKAICTSRSF